MIDRSKPLYEQPAGEIRALLDALHGNRERYDRANRIVEVRSCELEIAEATRALAIINRRATEAEDQRVAEEGADFARRVITEEQVRKVVIAAVRKIGIQQTGGHFIEDNINRRDLEAIADRAAQDLTGAVIGPSDEERKLSATLRGLRNALLGWRDDVEAACLDWGHTITDRIDALLTLAPLPDGEQTQRDADLREAVKYGMDWAVSNTLVTDSGCGATVDPPTDDARDLAAAEYARSKAGG